MTRQPVRRARAHVLAEQHDPPGERRLHARDRAQQRRLAGAVRPQQTHQLALLELEVRAVEQAQLAPTAQAVADRERAALDQVPDCPGARVIRRPRRADCGARG